MAFTTQKASEALNKIRGFYGKSVENVGNFYRSSKANISTGNAAARGGYRFAKNEMARGADAISLNRGTARQMLLQGGIGAAAGGAAAYGDDDGMGGYALKMGLGGAAGLGTGYLTGYSRQPGTWANTKFTKGWNALKTNGQ
jgi:hypothetical protein